MSENNQSLSKQKQSSDSGTGKKTKQQNSFVKKSPASTLGFRTPSFFRASKFGSKGSGPKFDPARFKTQHKG